MFCYQPTYLILSLILYSYSFPIDSSGLCTCLLLLHPLFLFAFRKGKPSEDINQP